MKFRFTIRDLLGLVAGLAIGMGITPFAVNMALASAGGGHGHYVAARLFFPFTMLLSQMTGSITLPLQILGIVQFPAYGAIVGFNCDKPKRAALIACIIFAAHALAVAICFSGLLSDLD
jgi:hypothetical protein